MSKKDSKSKKKSSKTSKLARKFHSEPKDIYALVTDNIIALLEQNIVAWRKPWAIQIGKLSIVSDENAPRSFATKRAYLGINAMYLSAVMLKHRYSSPFFITFEQVKQLAAASKSANRPHVKKGEKGHQIIFWERKIKSVEDKQTGEEQEKSFVHLRYYTVFNLDQCEHVEAPLVERQKDETTLKDFMGQDFEQSELAEKIFASMSDAPTLYHGGNKAFYVASLDMIQLPYKEQFHTSAAYYSTRFHELAHSTGHASRLNRESLTIFDKWGDETYSREELVAEMSAAMLMQFCNLSSDYQVEQSAAYIKEWLAVLKGDKQAVLFAAGQAQKAVEYMLRSFKQDDESIDEQLEATV